GAVARCGRRGDPAGVASATRRIPAGVLRGRARVRVPVHAARAQPDRDLGQRPVPDPEGGPPMSAVRLSVRDLTVEFGGVVAVDRLSLDVVAGEIVSLIGPNGAGKSTVINAITGFVPATFTEMALHDGDQVIALASSPPRQRSRLGIIRTFQTPRLIPELSVWQNVAMGTI